jgi:hypothetical protein
MKMTTKRWRMLTATAVWAFDYPVASSHMTLAVARKQIE